MVVGLKCSPHSQQPTKTKFLTWVCFLCMEAMNTCYACAYSPSLRCGNKQGGDGGGRPTMFTSFTVTHPDSSHHLGLFPVHGSYGHLRPSQRCGTGNEQGGDGGGPTPVSVSG